MLRLLPQFAIVLALLVMMGVLIVTGERPRSQLAAEQQTATTSVSAELPELTPLAPIIFPTLTEEEEIAPKPAPKISKEPVKPVAPTPVEEEKPATVAPVVLATQTPEPLPISGTAALDAAASVLRSAIVNIVCYVPQGLNINSMSGSGVFVDSKGIILTNAHIAQYFLLDSLGVSCTIRTGGPAVDAYKAEPIFVSSSWIAENAELITTRSPYGTGEHDFALLAVTKSATKESLPSSFPSIALATSAPDSAVPVVIAGYGAQFLESMQIQSFLFPTVVFGSLRGIFTFGTNTVDVLDLGGSAAAQKGSSGGGVSDVSGKLIGTITTSTIEGTTDKRELDAITATYMRGAYASETGEAIELLLARSVAASVENFRTQKKKALEEILLKYVH